MKGIVQLLVDPYQYNGSGGAAFLPWADVDQEIYDDCVTPVKPAVMEKPSVKNIAAMFGGGGPAGPKPSVGAKNSGKPVAVVTPSKTETGPSKVPLRTGPKPFSNSNGEVNNKTTNTTKPGGKVAVPGAFSSSSNGSASSNATLAGLRNSLKPVGGPKANNTSTSEKPSTSVISATAKKSPPFVPKSSTETPISKPPVTKTPKSPSVSPSAKSSQPKTDLCILVSDDNCKFRLKVMPKVIGSPPIKPSKLKHVDLSKVKSSQPPALPQRPVPKAAPKSSADGNFDEVYDDVDNVVQTTVRPVSDIKEYTEEEELGDVSGGHVNQETYDDVGIAPPPPVHSLPQKPSLSNSFSEGETYDDCAVEGAVHIEGEMDELYEALDDFQAKAISTAKDDKKDEKTKERERKEKREREKREKDEKERQKKIEKEKKKEKDLWNRLKITGNEVPVADGKVLENSKGGRDNLAVKKGQNVNIIRMTDCPQYKWLAKSQDGKIGYVDISNIEIMTGTLKTIKGEVQRESVMGDFEEVYDDVAIAEDPDQDIYEDTM
ncbi:FYN-binding protein 1-like isoform X2 [Liolophura sinensis]|uniref:FYN-binding protein 1-like isoform X2 n=1 Tax=Liolophura sinensis TaxID=3198878 RepID=UPI0031591C03